MSKKVILDTDMGVDCDDCVALALLLNKHKKGECELLCVTASSTREGATATIRAICDYYGFVPPIGAMALPEIPCDKINNYGRAVKNKYKTEDVTTDAVRLLRERLVAATEKVTLIAVGPLTNISRLLQSGGDDISFKTGESLVAEKVEALYIMGGSFRENYGIYADADTPLMAEWNIVQDVKAAQYVTAHFPCDMYFLPFEAGWDVYTDMGNGDNPVWYGMKSYAISEGFEVEGFQRHSWDPVTCLCATEDCSEWFDFSPKGRIEVTDEGKTVFEKGKGKASFAILKKNFKDIAGVINANLAPTDR